MRVVKMLLCLVLPAFSIGQSTITSTVNIRSTKCADAVIDLANGVSTANWGSLAETGLYAWTNGGNPLTGRTLIKFDLDSIRQINNLYLDIQSAILYLYTPDICGLVPQGNSGQNGFDIYRATSAWTENLVNWSTQPTYDNSTMISVPVISTQYGCPITINVTNLVKMMASAINANDGFFIKLSTEQIYRSVAIASREHANAAFRPWLEIVFEQNTDGANDLLQQLSNVLIYLNDHSELQCSFVPAENSDSYLYIMDILGQVISENRTISVPGEEIRFQIPVNQLTRGTYIVMLSQGSKTLRKKIIVQ
jgi:hypothetical protein